MSETRSAPTFGMVMRSVAFMVWMYGLLFLLGILALPTLLGPRRGSILAIRLWAKLTLWGLHRFVGLKVEVRGVEFFPDGSALTAFKHQSMLDAIAPFAMLDDPCFVLKRELMWLPIFGWYAARSRMIPVNRGGGSAAVKAMSAAAVQRLRESRQIVIFPEGTRKDPGAKPAYKSGVSALYRDLEFPCTPVATNCGMFWPPHGIVRRPGVAVYQFLPPIEPGLERAEFMRALEERIETATDALVSEAGA